MRRGLWFVAGAGAGIYAMVRGRRAAEALTVDGLSDRLGALSMGMSSGQFWSVKYSSTAFRAPSQAP